MSRRKVTIPDIAVAAGVSKSTVSLALQDSAKLRPETRKKVQRVAKRLGYVYNRAAANLRRQSSDIIAMVINDLTNPFFAELAVGIERALTDAGYVVLLANTSEDLARQEKVIATFGEQGAAGLILCPAYETPPGLAEDLSARGMALVTVMRSIEGVPCDFVAPDNPAGTRAATDHLLGQGLRRLAFLGGREGTQIYNERLAGFLDAHQAAGLPGRRALARGCELSRAAASRVTEALMAGSAPPEGIVCYSDVVAFGVYVGLDRMGLKAGRDVAVTGFDDVNAAGEVNPALTSVRVFTGKLGALAAETLLRRLADPESPAATNLIQPELIVRDSSTPLPRTAG
jgi:LacI family transcriptional regulator